jgi:ribosomal protein S6
MVLLDNREVKKGWNEIKRLVTGLLEKHGAKVASSRLWGERRLAYSVQHQNRGTFLLLYFTSATSAVNPIRRELELAEPVLRHLITTCDAIPDSAHEPEPEFDVTQIRDEAELPRQPRVEAPEPAAPEPEAQPAEAAPAPESEPAR